MEVEMTSAEESLPKAVSAEELSENERYPPFPAFVAFSAQKVMDYKERHSLRTSCSLLCSSLFIFSLIHIICVVWL